ncbi:hypothetical protein D3C80_1948610 [compost metagenome]
MNILTASCVEVIHWLQNLLGENTYKFIVQFQFLGYNESKIKLSCYVTSCVMYWRGGFTCLIGSDSEKDCRFGYPTRLIGGLKKMSKKFLKE